MSLVSAISFDLYMDRPVNEEIHYVVPGGYAVNHKQFDFETTNGLVIDEQDPKIIHFEGWDVCDVDGGIPTKGDVLSGNWGDFYIFTGEAEDAPIYAERVENVIVEFDNGSNFLVTGSALEKINEMIAENTKDAMEARRELERENGPEM